MSIRTHPTPRAVTAHISGRFRLPGRRFMIGWIALVTGTIAGLGIAIQLVASMSLGAGL
jgi:hypothetical protein